MKVYIIYYFYAIKNWLLGLFNKNKIGAKFTNEDRMNITDPYWRKKKNVQNSYFWAGVIILGTGAIWVWLMIWANSLGCTIPELLEKIYHHIIPHAPGSGKDLMQ